MSARKKKVVSVDTGALLDLSDQQLVHLLAEEFGISTRDRRGILERVLERACFTEVARRQAARDADALASCQRQAARDAGALVDCQRHIRRLEIALRGIALQALKESEVAR